MSEYALRRIFQFTFLLLGICVLGLVGMMSFYRSQPSGAAWLIYQAGTTIYRTHPDGKFKQEVITTPSSISHVISVPKRSQMLLLTSERDRMGREDAVVFQINYEDITSSEVFRIHEPIMLEMLSEDSRYLIFLSTFTDDLFGIDLQDGSTENLTETPSNPEIFLTASPNREWIVFLQQNVDGWQWKTLNIENSVSYPLIDSGDFAANELLLFSVDNEWIYFNGTAADHYPLYRVRLATGDVEWVINVGDEYSVGTWSQDGRYLPLMMKGSQAIFLFDAATTAVFPLTDPLNAVDRFLDWSTDGKWMYFESDRDNDSFEEIYRIHIDGTDIQRLTYFNDSTDYLTQSGDGRWIIFQSYDERNRPILYGLNHDAQQQYQITLGEDFPSFETWSPDGEWIYFEGGANGDRQLFRVQIDGSHRQQ